MDTIKIKVFQDIGAGPIHISTISSRLELVPRIGDYLSAPRNDIKGKTIGSFGSIVNNVIHNYDKYGLVDIAIVVE